MGTTDVFISYAAEDTSYRDKLEAHLTMLRRDGQIRSWHAGRIRAGEERDPQVDQRLRSSQCVVLLVTADYIAGDTWEREMEPALARARARSAVVIPVLIKPYDWKGAPFAGLVALPKNQVPVTSWADPEAAWADVVKDIREAIEKMSGSAGVEERIHPPVPRFENARVKQLASDLDVAQKRRKTLLQLGAKTAKVDQEILELRRKLREGGRLREGDVLSDRYCLIELIGHGGFGTVWSAFDRERQENIAVKVLHPEMSRDPVRFERFFRGARVMARLGHEAVVRVHCEQGEDEGWFYFVMERLAGDLHHEVLRGAVSKERAVLLTLRVGGALAEAHTRGIVHRDVKPGNVLLDSDGDPRLSDFDLVALDGTTGGTRTGAMGSWGFAAPEQMQDARTADARADVYGLGMTLLFCLLGGKLPPRSPVEAIAALSCGEALKAVLAKAVEVEPSARYADAAAFCAALRAAEDRAPPPGAPARLALAHEFGEDQYGWYMSFKVGPALQRLRWVPSATFVMGSPKSEVGHYDHEGPPHEVEITEGYWLAETPCAQALWGAVMGHNPSRFKSPDRPVEQVSWEDCQRFLERLNERVPGLGARLPTEAEWERACRAGTTGATWAGELDVRGENNAPVLDAIAWYGGNSGKGFELKNGEDSLGWREKQYKHKKAGTRPMAQKAPNPLGFYDMLGNVWEWCEDWYAAYGAGPAIDPRGPATASRRVTRGGAWYGPAKFVRAAHRGSLIPSNRSDNLGFRLACGQGA